MTCGQGEKGVGKGVDISAVGQKFRNVEGNFARGAAGHHSLSTIVCTANDSSALRTWDEFDNSNFGGNFPGYYPSTSLHNLTSLANLGTQKSVQHTDHTY